MMFHVILAFLGSFLAILMLRPLAFQFNLLDAPGGRKMHVHPTPLVGGLSIFAGLTVGFFVKPALLITHGALFWSLFAGIFLLMLCGLADDRYMLSPKFRFVVQLVSGALMTVWGGISLHHLGDIFFPGFDPDFGLFAIPLTLFGVVIIVNAINFLDGVDGLAGSIILVNLSFLAWIAWKGGRPSDLEVLLFLIVSVISFLLFNGRFLGRKFAAIFMGDSGSLFLGFAIVWFSVQLSQPSVHHLSAARPIAFLWLVALPVYDVLFVTLHRLRLGVSPIQPDRYHIHHLLEALGCRPNQIVLLMASFSFLMGLVGVVAEGKIPDYSLFALFVALFVVYFVIISRAWKYIKRKEGT